MKPRIFVSSTFYDLKYIRDDLSNFIKAHDFEPIMFEEGDIGYTPGKQLDESCYEAMRNADMVVLIIGGNYGSPASGEKEDFFEEYLSITRKEYKTASEEGIPIFVFVDASVYSEYSVYEANIDLIEKDKHKINFCATKNINIFRFIKEIKTTGSLSITEFKKAGEIKSFLGKQWADMFKTYLKSLREEKNTEQIHEAIDNMSSLIQQMEIMINGLGQKVINNDKNVEFDNLKKQQRHVKAREIARKISRNIVCEFLNSRSNGDNIEIFINTLCDLLEKANCDDGDLEKNIQEFVEKLYNRQIYISRINMNIFKDESIYDICDDSDLKSELKRILRNDFYYSKLTNSKSENEVEN